MAARCTLLVRTGFERLPREEEVREKHRLIVTHYGGPGALRVVEEECPELKDGEVR